MIRQFGLYFKHQVVILFPPRWTSLNYYTSQDSNFQFHDFLSGVIMSAESEKLIFSLQHDMLPPQKQHIKLVNMFANYKYISYIID